jgi:hypothetical protein
MPAALRLIALCAALFAAGGAAAAPDLKTIVIVDFELIDDTYDKTDPETRRLAVIGERLRRDFAAERFYDVLDIAPAADQIARLRQSQNLHDCKGCAQEIGRSLGADRVLVGWVQKVSRLILNVNLQIIDVQTEAVVLAKSVDLRGNTDESWLRGINHLVRDMREKGQGNR